MLLKYIICFLIGVHIKFATFYMVLQIYPVTRIRECHSFSIYIFPLIFVYSFSKLHVFSHFATSIFILFLLSYALAISFFAKAIYILLKPKQIPQKICHDRHGR